MKIDAYNKVAQLYQANNKATKVKEIKSKSEKDKVEISRMGQDINIAKHAVAEVSDVRTEKIEQIEKKMSEGVYEISNAEIADKLVEKYMQDIL